MIEPPSSDVLRRREAPDVPARDLTRAIRSGAATRIAPGSFATTGRWRELTPIAQHAQRVWEATIRLAPGAVFSHFAAAAVLGIDHVLPWPEHIDVTTPGAAGSSGRIRRHRRPLAAGDVVPWGDHFVTTPARTVVDLASIAPFTAGVVIADQALWARRSHAGRAAGPLCSRDELEIAASAYTGRAQVRVAAVVAFATDLADSVRESESRVLIDRLGFPAPILQQRFSVGDAGTAYADFWWPDHRQIGEFDGAGKYFDPELRGGRSPQAVLLAEKDRGDALRRQVRAVSRWRMPHLRHPRLLYDILRGDGLPSSRPRPGR